MAAFVMVLALLTALLAIAPYCIGHHVENLNGSNGIVTCDDQFTTPWAFFGCLVANDDAEAHAWVEYCREGIID